MTGESDLESESGEHLGQRAEDSDEDQRGAPASSSAAPVVVEDVDEEPQGEPASGFCRSINGGGAGGSGVH